MDQMDWVNNQIQYVTQKTHKRSAHPQVAAGSTISCLETDELPNYRVIRKKTASGGIKQTKSKKCILVGDGKW